MGKGDFVNFNFSLFFDSPRVISETDRVTRKAFSKFGAFVQTGAKSRIRKRKKPSKPGQSPSSHRGYLKKLIFFQFDPARKSVIIGPAHFNQIFFTGEGPRKGTVPQVLEEGGTIGILEVFKWGRWQRADLRSKRRNAGLPTRIRKVHIAPRPYMQPAFENEIKNLDDIWASAVK